jgi:hypothetical protein
MARKRNPEQIAQFARLLAAGIDATTAYERAGWRRDTANAARMAKDPEVRRLVREYQAEAAVALTDIGIADAEGAKLLRLAAERAIQSGNLTALVQAGKAIAEGDRSLDALRDTPEEMTVGEMLELAASIDRVLWYAVARCLMLLDDKGEPTAPWTDGYGKPVPPYIDAKTWKLVE